MVPQLTLGHILMFDVQQDKLATPEALVMPPFEEMLAEVITITIAHYEKHQPELVDSITETLKNPFELSAIIAENSVKTVRNYIRNGNHQALQMFAYWAKGSNLDTKLSDMGLKRQVISEGDDSQYPPVPPVMESDEDALQRYMLSPFSFSTGGTNKGYRFHALTLNERPVITVSKPMPNQVTLTYTFPEISSTSKVKDAQLKARRNEIGDKNAEIDFWFLSRETEEGIPSAELLAVADEYLNRDDIAKETDVLFMNPAEIVRYPLTVNLYGENTPIGNIDKATAESALRQYVDQMHQLKGRIDYSYVDYICHKVPGVKRATSSIPLDGIVCGIHQAPYCTSIEVMVHYESLL